MFLNSIMSDHALRITSLVAVFGLIDRSVCSMRCNAIRKRHAASRARHIPGLADTRQLVESTGLVDVIVATDIIVILCVADCHSVVELPISFRCSDDT